MPASSSKPSTRLTRCSPTRRSEPCTTASAMPGRSRPSAVHADSRASASAASAISSTRFSAAAQPDEEGHAAELTYARACASRSRRPHSVPTRRSVWTVTRCALVAQAGAQSPVPSRSAVGTAKAPASCVGSSRASSASSSTSPCATAARARELSSPSPARTAEAAGTKRRHASSK